MESTVTGIGILIKMLCKMTTPSCLSQKRGTKFR
jgi:hypothetical protein